MRKNKSKILIIDDSAVTRKSLCDILNPEYMVIETVDGRDALEKLSMYKEELVAVITDVYMPKLDGYEFIRHIASEDEYKNIPVIVGTSLYSAENEKKALEYGAWDFVAKPYDSDILRFRLKNAIERSQIEAFKKLKYLAEYDELTGIYNKNKFFEDTKKLIRENGDRGYAFVRYDIDRFKLINSFYGNSEADGLLKYMAKTLKKLIDMYGDDISATYGRIESDVFAFCIPYEKGKLEKLFHDIRDNIEQYNKKCTIVPTFGVYVMGQGEDNVERIYDYAHLAAQMVKGSYTDIFYYYNDELSKKIEREQLIINEMNNALNEEQFEVYLQQKFNIITGRSCGAEALVRWVHPVRGVITPGEFIPLFENNGFIVNLDFYVWESVCKAIRNWIDQGKQVLPISINVSRVNLYNPNITDVILNLVETYRVPKHLLQLEITESAYSDNPIAIRKITKKLQDAGFCILMDDFGSAYSSLNMLKDISVDILKADMNFLSESEIAGRGENIMASVIRMSKWLKVPVIVEGVETYEQLKFLKSIGCEYVQGYLFAKPMPLKDYEVLLAGNQEYDVSMVEEKNDLDIDVLFRNDPQMKVLFSDFFKAMVIYEFDGKKIDILRANEGYYELLNQSAVKIELENPMENIVAEYRTAFLEAFEEVAANKDRAECVYARNTNEEKSVWVSLKLKYLREISGVHLIMGIVEDITAQRETDIELAKFKAALNESHKGVTNMLIVDDVKVDRVILKQIFKDAYNIFEAKNGKEALEIMEKENLDVILLDLIMPSMDGKQFLEVRRKSEEWSAIPVIVITGRESADEQLKMLQYGISDYIVKPFVPEVVEKRVTNVMEANSRMKEIIRKYAQVARLAKIDQMTEVYNRMTTIKLVEEWLKNNESGNALIMLDVDNFKQINDTYGHITGDLLIGKFADILKGTFRVNDIIGRMGGDEFVVFMSGIDNTEIVVKKCRYIADKLSAITIGDDVNVSCSFGVALSPQHGRTFEKLYECADKALYEAKNKGKNQYSIYQMGDIR